MAIIAVHSEPEKSKSPSGVEWSWFQCSITKFKLIITCKFSLLI